MGDKRTFPIEPDLKRVAEILTSLSRSQEKAPEQAPADHVAAPYRDRFNQYWFSGEEEADYDPKDVYLID